jgi:hypothetical protein
MERRQQWTSYLPVWSDMIVVDRRQKTSLVPAKVRQQNQTHFLQLQEAKFRNDQTYLKRADDGDGVSYYPEEAGMDF